jgi:mRNA interferase YafQ
MYQLVYTTRFKKDVSRLKKRGFEMEFIKQAIVTLEKNGELTILYKPHKLTGNYIGYWEGHIKPNWLLIWKKIEKEIWLTRTGTHSDLFG